MNKCQPVFNFLTPPYSQATPFSEPAQRAFDHPTSGRVLSFTRGKTVLKKWLTAATTMFDVGNIALQLNKLMDISIIIATIHAEMLLKSSRVRTWHDNRDNQVVGRPLVMTVRASHIHRQRGAALVDQQVDLAPLFAAVRRVSPGSGAAQWGGAALAVQGLSLPFDRALSGIEPDHDLRHPDKRAVLLPGLKTRMQRAAAHPKPVFMHRFPLAARPQDIPDAVQDRPIVRWGATRPALVARLRKQLPNLTPQWPRYMKVVDIFRFLGSILAHSTSRFRWVGRTPILSEMCSFFTFQSFYG